MTTNQTQPYRLDYQPQLLEESVLLAMAGHEDEHLFRYERDQIYERFEREEREAAFQQLHRSWFELLQLGEPVQECFRAWPILREATQQCLIIKARAPKEVGAELYRAPVATVSNAREQQTIIIQLTATLLSKPVSLLAFLQHELLHVVDMLDPHFQYEPNLPKAEAGPAYNDFLQKRYSALWDITIDGRLAQRGWLPDRTRERHWENFKRLFAGEERELAEMFAFLFEKEAPTHHTLVSFALAPENFLTSHTARRRATDRCSLCHFPSFHLHTAEAKLARTIRAEYPHWTPAQLLCQQCLDLFEARALFETA